MDVFPVWAPALARGEPGVKQLLHSPPLAPETKKTTVPATELCNQRIRNPPEGMEVRELYGKSGF